MADRCSQCGRYLDRSGLAYPGCLRCDGRRWIFCPTGLLDAGDIESEPLYDRLIVDMMEGL